MQRQGSQCEISERCFTSEACLWWPQCESCDAELSAQEGGASQAQKGPQLRGLSSRCSESNLSSIPLGGHYTQAPASGPEVQPIS